jgi:hypothetical protein
MGSKRSLSYSELIVDGDMSSDITGPSTNILHLDRVGFQLLWTGSPTGTFSVQVSNDEVTWADLTLSAAIAAAGSGDNAFIDAETGAAFIRVKYSASSGTGTLQAHIVAKSISG